MEESAEGVKSGLGQYLGPSKPKKDPTPCYHVMVSYHFSFLDHMIHGQARLVWQNGRHP